MTHLGHHLGLGSPVGCVFYSNLFFITNYFYLLQCKHRLETRLESENHVDTIITTPVTYLAWPKFITSSGLGLSEFHTVTWQLTLTCTDCNLSRSHWQVRAFRFIYWLEIFFFVSLFFFVYAYLCLLVLRGYTCGIWAHLRWFRHDLLTSILRKASSTKYRKVAPSSTRYSKVVPNTLK